MIYKLIILNKFVQVELGSYDNFEDAAARLQHMVKDLQNKNYKSYIYIVAVNDKNYDKDYIDTDIISNIKRMNDDVRKETRKLW